MTFAQTLGRVNVHYIETGKPIFFGDIDGQAGDPEVRRALDELAGKRCLFRNGTTYCSGN